MLKTYTNYLLDGSSPGPFDRVGATALVWAGLFLALSVGLALNLR